MENANFRLHHWMNGMMLRLVNSDAMVGEGALDLAAAFPFKTIHIWSEAYTPKKVSPNLMSFFFFFLRIVHQSFKSERKDILSERAKHGWGSYPGWKIYMLS